MVKDKGKNRAKDPIEAGPVAINRKARRRLFSASQKTRNLSSATSKSSTPSTSCQPTQHSQIISTFHALQKRLSSNLEPGERAVILRQIDELGGVEAYQAASVKGGRGEEGDGWLVRYLVKADDEVQVDKGKGIRLLDVGSILGTSYTGRKARRLGIIPSYIDLNPQSSNVTKADFLKLKSPPQEEKFDVVALSLVINYVGSLAARAQMLIHAHSFFSVSGLKLLYIVLPSPCLLNSRYMDHARFKGIVEACNYRVVEQEESNGGKLSYWLLRWNGEMGVKRGESGKWKRCEVRSGAKRNNFCIVL